MASNEISQKEPTALNQKIEELAKFLVRSRRFISRGIGQKNEEDIIKSEATQKKLAKLFKVKRMPSLFKLIPFPGTSG